MSALNILAVAAECQQVVEGVAGGWEVPAVGQQGGGLWQVELLLASMGMSGRGKGAPWKPGLGVRQLACCSLSLQEYIILLLSEEAEEYMHRWLRVENSVRDPGVVIV